jgi:hypothetical protein
VFVEAIEFVVAELRAHQFLIVQNGNQLSGGCWW